LPAVAQPAWLKKKRLHSHLLSAPLFGGVFLLLNLKEAHAKTALLSPVSLVTVIWSTTGFVSQMKVHSTGAR
jgi:hypothetical protein